MRKFAFTILSLAMATSVFGQSKLDLQSQMMLLQLRNTSIPTYNSRLRTFERAKEVQQNVMAMIEFNGQNALAELEKQGVKVLRVRGNIAIVTLPTADVERISDLKCVRRMELSRPVYQKMDIVRSVTGIDKIHQGINLPQAYTGKGVVTGIVDGGIDPNHINFLKPDGTTRFGYLSKITATTTTKQGYLYQNYYPRAVLDTMQQRDDTYPIEEFATDSYTNFHGTHTLGIMAGGYKGNIVAAKSDNQDVSYNVTVPNLYYGGATESEIIASCGDLRDQFIAFGVDDIINYAKLSGPKRKPCVINLSLGSNVGAHDSTSVMNRFLALCGKEAIICVAAGNEADQPIALTAKFDKADSTVQTFIRPMMEGEYKTPSKTYYNLRNGQICAYSNNADEFELQIVVTNAARDNKVAVRIPVATNTNGQPVTYSSGGEYAITGAVVNSTFAKAFNGYISAASIKDQETGRYYVLAQFLTSDNQTTNKDGNYKLGLIIKSKKAGQRVDVYGDAQFVYFDDYDQKDWVKGSRNGSISDMACAANVISVGSYNVRNHWPSLDGYVYGYNKKGQNDDFPAGEVSRFSSYGTLADGRNLPDICAPGASVVSSVNTYCVTNPTMGYTNAALQAKFDQGGKTYFWHQSLGTSMATPVVAGAIALWLEANPNLTYKDVVRIIKETAVKDNYVTSTGDPVQWGAGKFDAYAGLKQVLLEKNTSGIQGVKTEQKELPILNMTGSRSFTVFLANAKQLNVRAYNLSGQLVQSHVAKGNETNIDASSWEKGVYLIQVNGSPAQRIIIY
ncbi:S8 family serine peptidase [Prevotella aurantiaca]|uniref:S8 family serine peptidase n=1 Tax=Prevotella aurantiaca TaxID=596085 RepID=UPI0028DB68D5|nr:S8 family serine peptidase [Prevotella aurantiaca]